MKALALAGACVLSLGLLIPAANADAIVATDAATFPFTGTGTQFSSNFHFQITGQDFLYTIGTSEGPLVVALCPTPGSPCSFERNYTAGVLPPSDQFGVTAIVGGIETHVTTGTLTFLGMLTPPTALGPFDATIPVSFAANIVGRGAANQNFPVLFNVLLGGLGTAQLSGFVDESQGAIINQAQWTFSGTGEAFGPSGEPIPEPASILLTGGGAGVLGLLYRRRRAARV
jgi:hypothetical protein